MNLRGSIGLFTAAAILVAGLFPAFSPIDASDANGDTQVDILDLQYVIAQVLAEGSPPTDADVNGDGRIDILDFQQILDAAAQEEDAGEAPSSPDTPMAVAPVTMTGPLMPQFLASAQAVQSEDGDAVVLPPADAAPPPRRYLRHAPTHAPPALG